MTSTRQARLGLVGALLVLVVLAFVGLSLDRDPPTSPLTRFDDADVSFVPAPDDGPVDVPVARVCGPDGDEVTIREVDPVGGSGTVAVAGFEPTRVAVDCASEEPVTLVASLRRTSGESASVEGFVIRYSLGDTNQEDLVTRGVTLCRQPAEC